MEDISNLIKGLYKASNITILPEKVNQLSNAYKLNPRGFIEDFAAENDYTVSNEDFNNIYKKYLPPISPILKDRKIDSNTLEKWYARTPTSATINKTKKEKPFSLETSKQRAHELKSDFAKWEKKPIAIAPQEQFQYEFDENIDNLQKDFAKRADVQKRIKEGATDEELEKLFKDTYKDNIQELYNKKLYEYEEANNYGIRNTTAELNEIEKQIEEIDKKNTEITNRGTSLDGVQRPAIPINYNNYKDSKQLIDEKAKIEAKLKSSYLSLARDKKNILIRTKNGMGDTNPNLRSINNAIEVLEKMEKLASVPRGGIAAFWHGIKTTDFLKVATFGIGDAVDNFQLANAQKRVANAQKNGITPNPYDLAFIKATVYIEDLQSSGVIPWQKDGGSSIMESIPLLIEIGLGGLVTAPIKKAIIKSISRVTGSTLSKATGAIGASAAHAALSPITLRNMSERQNDNYDVQNDEFGNVSVEKFKNSESLLKSYGAGALGTLGTLLVEKYGGEYLEKGVSFAFSPISKKIGSKIGFDMVKVPSFVKKINTLQKDIGWHGVFGETAEEYQEKLYQALVPPKTEKEKEYNINRWENFFDKDEFLTIISSVSVMQGVFGVANVCGRAYNNRQAYNDIKSAGGGNITINSKYFLNKFDEQTQKKIEKAVSFEKNSQKIKAIRDIAYSQNEQGRANLAACLFTKQAENSIEGIEYGVEKASKEDEISEQISKETEQILNKQSAKIEFINDIQGKQYVVIDRSDDGSVYAKEVLQDQDGMVTYSEVQQMPSFQIDQTTLEVIDAKEYAQNKYDIAIDTFRKSVEENEAQNEQEEVLNNLPSLDVGDALHSVNTPFICADIRGKEYILPPNTRLYIHNIDDYGMATVITYEGEELAKSVKLPITQLQQWAKKEEEQVADQDNIAEREAVADKQIDAKQDVSKGSSKIPTDDKGNLLYEEAPEESTVESLIEDFGEDAPMFVESALDKMQNELNSMLDKEGKPKRTGDLNKDRNNYKRVQSSKKVLDYWKSVSDIINGQVKNRNVKETITEDVVVDKNNKNLLQDDDNSLPLQSDKQKENGILESISQRKYRALSEEDSRKKNANQLRRRIEEASRNASQGEGERESREGSRSEKEINQIVESEAKEKGLWIPITDLSNLGSPFLSGNENNNYLDAKNGTVYKMNNLINSGNLCDLFKCIDLHNAFFPQTKYSLVGFTGFGNEGTVYPIYKQEFIANTVFASTEEIDEYMHSLGFESVGEAAYSNGNVTISDLRPRNVLKDADGDIYVVDAEFSMPKEDAPRLNISESITEAERKVDTQPTEAQKEAGNYKKGHVKKLQAYGSSNTLISSEEYEELKRKMREKLANLNAGFDPELLELGIKMSLYHIEAGSIKFVDFSKQMIQDMGLKIKPYLKAFYNGARDMPGMEDYEMDLSDVVSKTDLNAAINIDNAEVETVEKIKKPTTHVNEIVENNNTSGVVSKDIEQKYKKAKKIYGKKSNYILPNNSKKPGIYVIVESGTVTTSHSPFTFAPTDGFPTDLNGNTVNDRDYQKDKQAQLIVESTAQKYNGKAVQDVPVVSKDGIVLSGNNRSMSGVIAARNNTDDDYLEKLYEDCSMYGFSKDEIQQTFKHPRIILELDENLPYTTKTFALFNNSDMKTQNKVEKAIKFGKQMDNSTILYIGRILENYDTMSEFYVDNNAINDLLKILLSKEVLSNNDIPEWKDGKSLSAIGKDMLEAMLIGNILEENSIRFLNADGMKQYRAKIVKSILPILNNKSMKIEFSLMPELNSAIYLLNKKKVCNFGSIKQTLNSPELFGDKRYSEETIILAKLLDNGKQKDIKQLFNDYNENVKEANGNQGDIFGEIKQKKEVLHGLFKLQGENTQRDEGVHRQSWGSPMLGSVSSVRENSIIHTSKDVVEQDMGGNLRSGQKQTDRRSKTGSDSSHIRDMQHEGVSSVSPGNDGKTEQRDLDATEGGRTETAERKTGERKEGATRRDRTPLLGMGKDRGQEIQPGDTGGKDRRPDVRVLPNRGRSNRTNDELVNAPITKPSNTNNNVIERGERVSPNGDTAKITANMTAIKLMKQLVEEGESATTEQMKVLQTYTGWGGLSSIFKDSHPRYQELRDLLTEQEYDSAMSSTTTSFYTPVNILNTLWDVVQKLGFDGGNILESSAGIGHILGTIPKEISNKSNLCGIELDEISGNILKLLYPDADIRIGGFETQNIKNGSVDLAITNVPFANVPVFDKVDTDLSKRFRKIHDYFIAKNIRKLKAGGIGIFITSSGTMDGSINLRKWIISEGDSDVIGAFRLNSDTFKKESGTEATSDIVIVLKRTNGIKSSHAIDITGITTIRTDKYVSGTKYNNVTYKYDNIEKNVLLSINSYFANHTENMAGEMKFGFEGGNAMHPTEQRLAPVSGKDQKEMLASWVNTFNVLFHTNSADQIEDKHFEKSDKKEGSLFIKENNIYTVQNGEEIPLAINSSKVNGYTKQECVSDYLVFKNAIQTLLKSEYNNNIESVLNQQRHALNNSYDTFVSKYGHINKNSSLSFLSRDIDFPAVQAVENIKVTPQKDGSRKITFSKSDLFSKRMIGVVSYPSPKNVKDALVQSIAIYNRIDINTMSKNLHLSEENVREKLLKEHLAFVDPLTDELQERSTYLSGNVREKLKYAKENNEHRKYDDNIDELEKRIPSTIPMHLIGITVGSSWIPTDIYENYFKEVFDRNVSISKKTDGRFYMKYLDGNSAKDKEQGAKNDNRILALGSEMAFNAMNNHITEVKKSVYDAALGKSKMVTDTEGSAQVKERQQEIAEAFSDWVHTKTEYNQRIEEIYNIQFNSEVIKTVDDAFLPEFFIGASQQKNGKELKLRNHQRRGVIKALSNPVIFAHEVGTGKTMSLITTAMEMKRLGTAKKPCIVVQRSTMGQFVKEIKELYPNANILSPSKKDLTAVERQNLYAKIRLNDWDIVVLYHDYLDSIPDSIERQEAYIREQIEEKLLFIEEAQSDNNIDKRTISRYSKELEDLNEQLYEIANGEEIVTKKKKSVKDTVKIKEKIAVKTKELLNRRTDNTACFEELGIDALLIDEAHRYKRLGFNTAIQKVKGIDTSSSKRSHSLFLKTRYILENNSWKNVVFATGTPISNTAAEMWTYMRYFLPNSRLNELDIRFFDNFVKNFGNINTSIEYGTNGKFRANSRFASYKNCPELMRIWLSFADVVLTEEVKEFEKDNGVPQVETGADQDIFLEQTPSLMNVMNAIKVKLEKFEKMSPNEKRKNSFIPLTMFTLAKQAAIDARLVDQNAKDEPDSKVNKTVQQVLLSLNNSKEYNGSVAIFCDNFRNKRSGFNLFDDMRQKLVDAGVPKEQIAVIGDSMYNNDEAKQRLFDGVNEGTVRVIMGSTEKLGVGVNIQERLHTLIHMDAPMRPSDYLQRNGRIVRQGNMHRDWNIPVRILRMGVKDTLDVTGYQRLAIKKKFIDQILKGRLDGARMIEEVDDIGMFDNPVANLSGSEFAMLKYDAESKLRKYKIKKKQYDEDQVYIVSTERVNNGKIRNNNQRIEELKVEKSLIAQLFPSGKVDNIEIDGKKASNKETINKLLSDTITKDIISISEKMRINPYMDSRKIDYNLRINDIDTIVKFSLVRSVDLSKGLSKVIIHKNLTYSIPKANIINIPIFGGHVTGLIKELNEEVLSLREFEDNIKNLTGAIVRMSDETEELLKRKGISFESEKELDFYTKEVENLTNKMLEEQKEKDKIYSDKMAELSMDHVVDIDGVISEDDENEDEIRYRFDEYEFAGELLEDRMLQQGMNNKVYPTAVQSKEANSSESEKPCDNNSKRVLMDDLAKRFGVKIHAVDRKDCTSESKRGAKGWFNTKDNSLYINLDNNINTEDVERTILHEVVGHYGMRKLFGDKYDNLCTEVFEVIPDKLREHYMHIASEHTKYIDKQKIIAGDEYIASISESGVEPTIWNKITAWIRAQLRTFGIKVRLSDLDIRALLYASTHNLERMSFAGEYLQCQDTLEKIREAADAQRILEEDVNVEVMRNNAQEDILNNTEVINERFNEELQQQINGTLPKGHIYQLGLPSNTLLSAGVEKLPIELSAERLVLKAGQENHPFDLKNVENLPDAIQNPIAVFDSKTQPNSKVILTELSNGEKNFVVAIKAVKERGTYSGKKLTINEIRSLYPKDTKQIIKWIKQGDLMKWVDKEKVLNWMNIYQFNSDNDIQSTKDFDTVKIIQNFENPKLNEDIRFKKSAIDYSNEFDVFDEVKRIVGASGYGLNSAYVKGITKDGESWEIRVGNHPANFDNFKKYAEDSNMPNYIVSFVVTDGFDGHGFSSSKEIQRELDRFVDSNTELDQIIIDVSELSADDVIEQLQDIEDNIQMFKETGRNYLGMDETVRFRSPLPKDFKFAGDFLNALTHHRERMSRKKTLTYEERVKKEKASTPATLIKGILDREKLIKKMQDYAIEKGGIVTDESDTYNVINHASSRMASAKNKFRKGFMEPLLKSQAMIIKKHTPLFENEEAKIAAKNAFTLYIMAKHIPERNRYFNKKENTHGKDYAGETEFIEVTGITAKEYVTEYEDEVGDKALIDEFWKAKQTATNFSLDYLLKTGLINKKIVTELKSRWQFYVPLRAWDEEIIKKDEEDDLGLQYSDKNKTHNTGIQQILKEAKGRKSLADDPIPYIAAMAETSICQGEKNRYKQSVYNFYEQNAEVIPEVFDHTQITKHIPTENKNEHEVHVFIDGTKYTIFFKDNELANAINKNNISQIMGFNTTADNKFGKLTKAYTSNMTATNPAFAVKNTVRDLQFAGLSLYITENPRYVLDFYVNYKKVQSTVFKGAFEKKLDLEDPYVKAYLDWQELGGETGYHQLRNIKDLKKLSSKELDLYLNSEDGSNKKMKLPGKSIHYINAWDRTGELFGAFTEMSENATRFAAYVTALQHGKTKQQAVTSSKNITVNFDRKGKWTQNIAWAYGFFNASIQGGAMLVKLARSNPKKATIAAISIFTMGYLVNMLRSMWDDDDKYKNTSDYIKYMNLTFDNFRLPLSHGFRSVFAAGVIASQWINKEKSFEEALFTISKLMSNELLPESINPISYLKWNKDSEEVILGDIRSAVPTILLPFYDVVTNTNYMGGRVYNEPYNKNTADRTPSAYKHKDDVNKIFKYGSYKLAECGGLDPIKNKNDKKISTEDVSWWLDWNPSIIEHILTSFGAGRVQFYDDIVKTAFNIYEMLKNDKRLPLNDVPFVNILYKEPKKDAYKMKLFYEFNDYAKNYNYHMKELQKSRNEYYKLGDNTNLEQVEKNLDELYNNPEYMMINEFLHLLNELNKIEKYEIENGVDESENKKYIMDRMFEISSEHTKLNNK